VAAVRLADPFDGKATKATAETLKRWLVELAAEVDQTRAEHERRGVAARRSAIVAETAAPGFWDDPVRAREALAELYQAERTSEALAAVVEEATRIAAETRCAGRATGSAEIARLAAEIERCRRQATILRFAILCDSRLQRADAFLVYDALDGQASEHVRQLADSHSAWARRLGFDVVEVHEERAGKGVARQIVLQINGAAVYGMLEGEDGLHEILPDAKSPSRLVRVTVMPVPCAGPDEEMMEVLVGAGKRPEVQATHRRTGQAITIRPTAGTADIGMLARELLAAEMARQDRLHAGAAPQEVVRRWWLGSKPSVRDPRTGVAVARIKDVLQGDIDRFLLAYLEQRGAEGDNAPSASG
jgi:peptide chain release factor 2